MVETGAEARYAERRTMIVSASVSADTGACRNHLYFGLFDALLRDTSIPEEDNPETSVRLAKQAALAMKSGRLQQVFVDR